MAEQPLRSELRGCAADLVVLVVTGGGCFVGIPYLVVLSGIMGLGEPDEQLGPVFFQGGLMVGAGLTLWILLRGSSFRKRPASSGPGDDTDEGRKTEFLRHGDDALGEKRPPEKNKPDDDRVTPAENGYSEQAPRM